MASARGCSLTDHKRIALLYLGSVTFFFFIGGLFATMIRIHLLTPTGRPGYAGNLQQAFHHAWRGHGLLFPHSLRSPPFSGIFLIPMMIGAKDLAFPRSIFSAGTST